MSKPVAAGTTIAYLQCGAPLCGLVAQLLAPAVKALGANLKIINAGLTASSAQAAASSVLALKPSAVIVVGVNPQIYAGGLKAISAAGVKVVSISISGDVKQYGINFNYVGSTSNELQGTLLADWVVANKGPNANVVFYGVPELTFTPGQEKAFQVELSKNCSSCKVRFASIAIGTIGTTAPTTIVTDLQSHPDTNTTVFGAADAYQGVPAAMKAAGISSLTSVVATPGPAQLQDIKDGSLTAGLGNDIPTQIWALIDVCARLINGQQPTPGEVDGLGPYQFLAQKDITFDPSHGWTGYPDFAQRFAKLWKQG